MKIEANIKFKHAKISNALSKANISVSELSKRCGWTYGYLVNFINLKGYPKKYDDKDSCMFERLYVELKKIDDSLEFDDIKPSDYDEAKISFKNIKVVKGIDFNQLEYEYTNYLGYDYGNIEEEMNKTKSVELLIDKFYKKELDFTKNALQEFNIERKFWQKNLKNYNLDEFLEFKSDRVQMFAKKRNIDIVKMYYGIGIKNKDSKTLEEVGCHFHLTKERVGKIISYFKYDFVQFIKTLLTNESITNGYKTQLNDIIDSDIFIEEEWL